MRLNAALTIGFNPKPSRAWLNHAILVRDSEGGPQNRRPTADKRELQKRHFMRSAREIFRNAESHGIVEYEKYHCAMALSLDCWREAKSTGSE